MRHLPYLMAALLLLGAPLQRALAQAAPDPQESFMRAFMAVRQGEELERQGKLKPSLAKFRFAASLLDQVRANNPEWQPVVVEYRTRRTREALERIEKKLAMETITTAPATAGSNLPLGDPDLPPVRTKPERIEQAIPVDVSSIPQPNDDPLPSNGTEVVVETRPSKSDTREMKKLRDRLDQIEATLAETKKKLATSEKEKKEIKGQLKETSEKLDEALDEVKTARKSEEKLKEQLATAQETIKTMGDKAEGRKALAKEIEDLKSKLADSQKQTEEKNKINEDLTAQLTDAKKGLEAMSADRDAMLKERDQALAQATQAKEAAAKMDAVVAENTSLSEKLASTEKKIEELTKDDGSLPALKDELIKVKEELASARKENESYELAMADLRKELDEASGELQKAKLGENPEESARLASENKLLKEIVLRELKEQARRDQAKKLVMEEVAKLENRSKQMEEQLEILAAPVVQLTDEERALFRRPQMELVETESDADAAFQIIMPLENGAKPVEETPTGTGVQVASTTDTPVADEPAPTGQLTSQPAKEENLSSNPKVLTESTPKVPVALQPLALEARELFNKGDYRQAEKVYEKILAKEPKNLYALSNQGVVLFRSNKMKAAEITFKKATSIAPEDSFSFAMLGIVYYQLAKYDDAIDVLTKAITIDPKNAAAHNYLGITASQKGWQEAAEEEIQKALAINPKYADAHFNLAVIYATSTPPSKELAKRHYGMAIQYGAAPDAALEALIQGEQGGH